MVNSPFSKILGIYLNAVLYQPKSTRKSRFLMFSIEVDRIISIEETVYPVLAMITESCNRLTKEGIDGTHFLVSEIRGDQLFYKSIFRHQSWWKSNHVCFRCGASCAEGSLNYTNYDGWQGTRRAEVLSSLLQKSFQLLLAAWCQRWVFKDSCVQLTASFRG